MLKTLEATVDANGHVYLSETIKLPAPRRALVTILDEAPCEVPVEIGPNESALLAEAALAEWNSAEEDEAWRHLDSLPDLRHQVSPQAAQE